MNFFFQTAPLCAGPSFTSCVAVSSNSLGETAIASGCPLRFGEAVASASDTLGTVAFSDQAQAPFTPVACRFPNRWGNSLSCIQAAVAFGQLYDGNGLRGRSDFFLARSSPLESLPDPHFTLRDWRLPEPLRVPSFIAPVGFGGFPPSSGRG